MAPAGDALGRVNRAAIAVAHRAETGIRDRLARLAAARGWTPAVLPYPGYSSDRRARILGRVVLAPPSAHPSARRGIGGWRRLLTLESPGTSVRIEVDGTSTTVVSDGAGLIDADLRLDRALEPGTTEVVLRADGRDPVRSDLLVFSDAPVRGIVCDIDDTVWVTGISHPLRAAWRTLHGTSATRRSVPGMAELLRGAIEGQRHPAVVYLSNGPWNLVGPVARFLERHRFPAGAVLMTDWGIRRQRWFRDGREHKASSLARLLDELPQVTWVLVGDDGEHDPSLYRDVAEAHPDRIAAVVLRRADGLRVATGRASGSVAGVPVMRGSDGDALLPRLRDALRATSE